MLKQDIVTFSFLTALLVALGFGMVKAQDYLRSDWRDVAECEQSYWTCDAQVGGRSLSGAGSKVVFAGSAKACGEYRAYKNSLWRATYECSTSGMVESSSCREIQTDCKLPHGLY